LILNVLHMIEVRSDGGLYRLLHLFAREDVFVEPPFQKGAMGIGVAAQPRRELADDELPFAAKPQHGFGERADALLPIGHEIRNDVDCLVDRLRTRPVHAGKPGLNLCIPTLLSLDLELEVAQVGVAGPLRRRRQDRAGPRRFPQGHAAQHDQGHQSCY
jgi:hypothetical protein